MTAISANLVDDSLRKIAETSNRIMATAGNKVVNTFSPISGSAHIVTAPFIMQTFGVCNIGKVFVTDRAQPPRRIIKATQRAKSKKRGNKTLLLSVNSSKRTISM